MASENDDTRVVPMRSTARRGTGSAASVPAGGFLSSSLLPAINRYSELLAKYAPDPGDATAAEVIVRMHPRDRQEAEQLAECLEPVMTPWILAARLA